MAQCPRCHQPAEPNQRFCSHCGQSLASAPAPAAAPPPAAACRVCGVALPAGYNLCRKCAASRPAPAPPPANPNPPSVCRVCGVALPAGYNMCRNCADRRPAPAPAPATPNPASVCRVCGVALPAGYNMCRKCAASRPAPAPAPATPNPASACRVCGVTLPAGYNMCRNCADRRQTPARPTPPTTPRQGTGQPPVGPPRRKSGGGCRTAFLVLGILFLFLLLVVAGLALWWYWPQGPAGSDAGAPPPEVTPLDPADTLLGGDEYPPPPAGNSHAGYQSPPLDDEPLPGVRLTAAAGALDQPRRFQARALDAGELRSFRTRLDERNMEVVAGLRLDGGMGPDDRLRKPLTVEFDLQRLGVAPEYWDWTGVRLTGDDGQLREVPVERQGSTLRFRTHHNLVGLLVVGATLISGALVVKADHESAEETEGKEWNGFISRSGKFNILWPAAMHSYSSSERTREAFRQLEDLWKHLRAGTLPPAPAPGVPPPYASSQALLQEIRAIEREFKGGWLRDEWAWPGALCIEDELEFAYGYLVNTRGFKPLDQRINVYLRRPWSKQANAVGLFEGALTRRAWLSINLDRAGPLDRHTDLGATTEGVNLQITLIHELFHAIQAGYVTGNDTVWCTEAAAVTLEQEIKPLYQRRSSAGIDPEPLLTSRDGYWAIYRRPLDVGGTVVGLIKGVEMLQHHGYGGSFFFEHLKGSYSGGPDAFLPDFMTQLQRTWGGTEALVKLAVSSGRLGRLYTDFAVDNAGNIWSGFDTDLNKGATPLDLAAKPRQVQRAVDIHPLSTPCYTLTVPGDLKKAAESQVVFFLKNLKASGITVQVREVGSPRWRELTGPVDRQGFSFPAATSKPGQCPLQVIGGFVKRDYDIQNKAELVIVALIPPQQAPFLPMGARAELADLKPDEELEIRWARSKLDRCPEFAGYRLKIEIREKGGTGQKSFDVPPKRDNTRLKWLDVLPLQAFADSEDSIELRISQAEVLQTDPLTVGPWSESAVVTLAGIGAMELKTYEGRISLLGGDRTYEKFTYYKVMSKTPKTWVRGFTPPGHPNVWMGSAVTWRWVVEANGGNHGDKVLHGSYLMKYTNGRVCCEAKFTHGKLDGEFRVYHEQGGLAGSGRYVNGVPDGQFPEYWIDGSLSRTEIWDKGKLKDTVFPSRKKN